MSSKPKDEIRREAILNMDVNDIKHPHDAVEYLKSKKENLSKEEIDRLEKLIGENSHSSLFYALITEARFEAGEPMLADNAAIATLYATEVLKNRFPLGEPMIKKNIIHRKNYETHFDITL